MHVRSDLAPFFVDMNRTREGADEGELPRHLTNPAHEYYSVQDTLMLRASPTAPQEEEEVLGYYDLYHGLLDLPDRPHAPGARLRAALRLPLDDLDRARPGRRTRARIAPTSSPGPWTAPPPTRIDHRLVHGPRCASEASGHGLGLTIASDVPYSGGFITRSHHDPEGHVHVIQLEVAMDAYMYDAVAAVTKALRAQAPPPAHRPPRRPGGLPGGGRGGRADLPLSAYAFKLGRSSSVGQSIALVKRGSSVRIRPPA